MPETLATKPRSQRARYRVFPYQKWLNYQKEKKDHPDQLLHNPEKKAEGPLQREIGQPLIERLIERMIERRGNLSKRNASPSQQEQG
mmetsp:Transcript_23736/g.42028  ORF Transcript_23736/g.42028 Transcript_23736/m.42028 type:complete len:87 (-) Transcript_23736:952-1212(-)